MGLYSIYDSIKPVGLKYLLQEQRIKFYNAITDCRYLMFSPWE